jgi:hypothetical protein
MLASERDSSRLYVTNIPSVPGNRDYFTTLQDAPDQRHGRVMSQRCLTRTSPVLRNYNNMVSATGLNTLMVLTS